MRVLEAAAALPFFARRARRLDRVAAEVAPILAAVRRRGDAALLACARRFDGFTGDSVEIPRERMAEAPGRIAPELRRALRVSIANVARTARSQRPRPRRLAGSDGVRLAEIVRPLDAVGAYVPSGRYPLPSTVVMTAVPARVAGVAEICVASPKPDDAILAAAAMSGATRLFAIGGAHAIAALAFGTETVPRVDRIVGPGNAYVAAAKRLLAGEVGIDFVAGPTEIAIVAAEGDPAWIAADLLAQAEHDPDAAALLLTPSRRLAAAVAAEVDRQLATLPTAPVARRALARHGAIVLVRSLEEGVALANRIAPEHLSLHDERLLPLVRHAGTVFLGSWSAEAVGDYAAGPSHVLPTAGAARRRGGLSAADFVKVIAVQRLAPRGLARLAGPVTALARAEGLEAHARSVEIRLDRPGRRATRAGRAGGRR
ncbi:MAG: histidinol dehydrogenase [Thermoanaerobaculia bacterium]|nr:histidinol dehydrogenase [Thermoanaerobaculia bacterium]MCZ7650068.1 histidinol dehydrogenase [Thermoanaerobaculia bacterium]